MDLLLFFIIIICIFIVSASLYEEQQKNYYKKRIKYKLDPVPDTLEPTKAYADMFQSSFEREKQREIEEKKKK